VELDRHFIERNDFAAARRGYDPDEVDSHLAEIAEAVNELKRAQRSSPASLASSAAEQVRGIVEAAEQSANQITSGAETEARRITDDASQAARQTREKADADAVSRVRDAEEASQRMLERANGVEGEIDRLLSELRSAAGSLVENIRSSSTQLGEELDTFRVEFASVREARLETDGGGGRSRAGAPSVVDTAPEEEDAGPVDAEPEIVAEVEEVVVEEVPVEENGGVPTDVTDETDAVSADEAEEEEAEVEEPAEEETPAVAEEAPEESTGGGGRSIRGAEGARLIALNMALNGTPRDETARYLSQNFDLDDQDSLLDEVYARVGG
jgi:DivIVA domain-containing protein